MHFKVPHYTYIKQQLTEPQGDVVIRCLLLDILLHSSQKWTDEIV